ncbi:MAG: hypothetical protein IT210_13735 [Armatimonadetes bacterium]|nr:hypothetical protein [Armatimonadota bacterium]
MPTLTRPETRKASAPPSARGVSGRAVLIGLALIPLENYWIVGMELVRSGIFPTVLTLLFTAIFFVFVLTVLNLPLLRYLPRYALSQGELLTVYCLLAIGASLAGCDVMQTLTFILGAPYHYTSDANRWDIKFVRYLPSWATVSDKTALKGFYEGSTSLYRPEHFLPWLLPIACWMGFVAVMLATMFCINAILRRQWVDSERLTFPIVSLPLAMTRQGNPPFFRQKALWMGFGLAAALNILNGLNFLYPNLPAINCKQAVDIGPMLVNKPWNAVGWLPLTFYPFAIGIGFIMPLDLSFSCWFFFWVWKAQRVIASMFGWEVPWIGGPASVQQLSGAWIGTILFALWAGRRYFKQAFRRAVEGGRRPEEADEPLSYRAAFLGAGIGCLLMIAFAVSLGMSVWAASAYMILYLALSAALTRIRAETGPPVHDMFAAGPDQIVTTLMGPQRFDTRTLTGMTLFYWLNRESCRSHPMPHQLEGFKIARAARLNARRLMIAMFCAGIIGGLATFWAVLHEAYRLGAQIRFLGPATWFATEGFNRLDSWMTSPPPTTPGMIIGMIAGFVVSISLLALRQRVLWFPLHPVGYIISNWWAIHLLWTPLVLAWLIKLLILRYGGLKNYRRALPFFLGLILGEFVVGALWQLIGLFGRITTYAFWI